MTDSTLQSGSRTPTRAAAPSSAPSSAPSHPPATKRRRWGCLFWGCLTSLLVSLLISVVGGLVAYRLLLGQVRQYTAESAVDIPEVEYTDEQLSRLRRRLEQLDQVEPVDVATVDPPDEQPDSAEGVTVDRPAGPGDLVLTAMDINALISSNPKLRGKVFVSIEDGQVGGEVSIPIDNLPGGEGRFFNATATFDVQLHDGKLQVIATDALVKGERAPQVVLDALAKKNLADDANRHPRVKRKLDRFESLTVVDDRVILRVKSKPPAIGGNRADTGDLESERVDTGETEDSETVSRGGTS